MTTPQQQQQTTLYGQPAPPPDRKPEPPLVAPQAGSELDDLLTQLVAAEAQKAEAEARVTAIKDRIKVTLTALYPRIPVIDIAPGQYRPALRLAWRTPRGLDTDRMKREARQVYDAFLVWQKPYWELRKRG